MSTLAPPLNLKQWIDQHRDLLKPPVCNKEVYPHGDYIIMIVGGPNGRRDYHYNEGAEFFYQLEGQMTLKTIQSDEPVDYSLNAGDIFLLPPKIPHSPVRFENSVGLVVESKRRPEEQDGLMWFCDQCYQKLYEEYFHLTSIEKDFLPVFDRFVESESLRTCKHCQYITPANNKL